MQCPFNFITTAQAEEAREGDAAKTWQGQGYPGLDLARSIYELLRRNQSSKNVRPSSLGPGTNLSLDKHTARIHWAQSWSHEEMLEYAMARLTLILGRLFCQGQGIPYCDCTFYMTSSLCVMYGIWDVLHCVLQTLEDLAFCAAYCLKLVTRDLVCRGENFSQL